MILLTEYEREFLKHHIENLEEILEKNDFDLLLDEISDITVLKGFDDDYDLTDLGREAQNIYDDVFYRNKKPLD